MLLYVFHLYQTCFLLFKDWHFTRDFPEENVYRVPIVFASDWLNEYFMWRRDIVDDYRFVYMGPKSTWFVVRLLFL